MTYVLTQNAIFQDVYVTSTSKVWYKRPTPFDFLSLIAVLENVVCGPWRSFHLSRLMKKTTNWLCAQRTLGSAWASAQSDQSSLSAWRKLGSLSTHWAHSKDSDQTGRILRLIWVFAGRTVILLVLSWGGSFFHVCDMSCVINQCSGEGGGEGASLGRGGGVCRSAYHIASPVEIRKIVMKVLKQTHKSKNKYVRQNSG